MNGNIIKSYSFVRANSSSSENVVNERLLLTLLKKTERSLRCNPGTALHCLNHSFCYQSHFCRVFKRETRLSPQIWRKLTTVGGVYSHVILSIRQKSLT